MLSALWGPTCYDILNLRLLAMVTPYIDLPNFGHYQAGTIITTEKYLASSARVILS